MSNKSEEIEEKELLSLENDFEDHGLTYHYRCSLKATNKPDQFHYTFEASFTFAEFPKDEIKTILIATIEDDRAPKDLLSIMYTSMSSVKYQYKAYGHVAEKEFSYEGHRSGINSSMLWAFGKHEMGDDFYKPQREIVKSLAMVVRTRILKIAKELGVEHQQPEEEKPTPKKEAQSQPKKEAKPPPKKETRPKPKVEEKELEISATPTQIAAYKRSSSFFGKKR